MLAGDRHRAISASAFRADDYLGEWVRAGRVPVSPIQLILARDRERIPGEVGGHPSELAGGKTPEVSFLETACVKARRSEPLRRAVSVPSSRP